MDKKKASMGYKQGYGKGFKAGIEWERNRKVRIMRVPVRDAKGKEEFVIVSCNRGKK